MGFWWPIPLQSKLFFIAHPPKALGPTTLLHLIKGMPILCELDHKKWRLTFFYFGQDTFWDSNDRAPVNRDDFHNQLSRTNHPP